MSDRYSQFVNPPVVAHGRQADRAAAAGRARARRGRARRVLLGGAGRVAGAARVLAELRDEATALDDRALDARAGLDAAVFNPRRGRPALKALVFDATGIADSASWSSCSASSIRPSGACSRPGG